MQRVFHRISAIPAARRCISVIPRFNEHRVLLNSFRRALLSNNDKIASSTFEMIRHAPPSLSDNESLSQDDLSQYLDLLLDQPLTPPGLMRIHEIIRLSNPSVASLVKLHCLTNNYSLLLISLNDLYSQPEDLSDETIVLVANALVTLNRTSHTLTLPATISPSTALARFLSFISTEANKDNPELYLALLHILTVAGYTQLAYKLKRAIAPKTMKRNKQEMNAMLRSYFVEKDEKGALMLLQVIQESEIGMNVDSLNLLMSFYVDEKRFEAAERVRSEIFGKMEPNLDTYLALLKWKGDAGSDQ